MLPAIAIAAGGLLAIAFVVVMIGSDRGARVRPDVAGDGGRVARPAPPPPPVAVHAPREVEAPVDVTVAQLRADYRTNEVGADERYRGHSLRVTGIVRVIAKDILGEPYVRLEGGAQANFSGTNGLGQLRPAQAVTMVCTGHGLAIGTVMLADCVLQ